jgi:hypothetical protein
MGEPVSVGVFTLLYIFLILAIGHVVYAVDRMERAIKRIETRLGIGDDVRE